MVPVGFPERVPPVTYKLKPHLGMNGLLMVSVTGYVVPGVYDPIGTPENVMVVLAFETLPWQGLHAVPLAAALFTPVPPLSVELNTKKAVVHPISKQADKRKD